MLQKVDQDRLSKILDVIKQLKMRFPVAELTRELKMNKGNVSAYLKGLKPISENFYNTFMQKYGDSPVQAVINEGRIADAYNKKMEDSIYNLTISNSNLAIAFVKQATAHEKDAEARIIQATANKILVEVNRDTLSKIPDPLSAKEKYTQDSQMLTRTFDMMAKTLVRHGVYQSDEEATLYLGKLLTSEEEEETFLNKKMQEDTQRKHKS